MLGWNLVFRSGIGLGLVPGLFLAILARIQDEEKFLESKFGAQYAEYKRGTWRLLPFVY